MRSRIVTYFDRKNCANPEDLADEVLNRVSRRLEEEGTIETESPAKYCYTVARFVFMEQLRSPSAREVGVEELTLSAAPSDQDEAVQREMTFECLEHCASALDNEQREMITRYYAGEKGVKIANRKRMAEEMGISLNALGIRAFRTREKLEGCLTRCLASKGKEFRVLS